MKIAICVPVYSTTVKTLFASCLVALAIRAGMLQINGERPEIERFFAMGLLPTSRNFVAENALKWGADWTLWIDSDMTFPPDALERLLVHEKQIVGVDYRRRAGSTSGTARRWEFGKLRKIETRAGKGLEHVSAMGLGLVLISAHVLRTISEKEGLFEFGHDANGEFAGEDFIFFDKARRAGFSAYVDHTLSMEVGHLAETELRFPR